MSTIQRYLTFEILRPLSIALLIAVVVLLIERMLRLMDLILGANGPLEVVFQIMGYLVPLYLGLALPIGLLLGVMLAFNKLGRDGELDALHAAGVSLKQLMGPTLIIALIVAILSLLINGYLRPYGRYAYQAMLNAVMNTAFQTFVRAGAFTQIGDRTFLIEGVGSDGSRFKRVFMFQSDEGGREVAIAARDGTFARTESNGPPILRLFNGVRMELKPPETPADAPAGLQALTVLKFGELRTDLGTQTALMLRERGIDEKELTLTELWERRHTPPPGVRGRDLVAEFNARIVRSLTVPLLPLLAVSLAAGRRRSDRLAGIFVGLLVLVSFMQVIDFTKNLVENGVVGPLIALWLPWAVFAAVTIWMFWRISEGVPKDFGRWPGVAILELALRLLNRQFGGATQR